MINWRDGKAGFVGGLKRLIKGVFDPVYSVTTETAVPPQTSITGRFSIEFPPEDRSINFAYDDRNLMMPPNRRKVGL